MPPYRARTVGWRTAGACLALASILFVSRPAAAVDWQVLYRLTETARISDNIELRADPRGAAFSSHSGVGLDIAARTPTLHWGVSGDIGQLVFFGKGAPEDRKRTDVSARSDLLKSTRATDLALNAYFRRAPATGAVVSDVDVADPELADLGLELVNFDRISYGAGGGIVHRLTRVDELAVNASADRVDFTRDATGATPYHLLELSAVWTRRLTRRIDGRAHASVALFRADDDSDLRRVIYKAIVGSNVRATRQLTVDATAGMAIIDQRKTSAAITTGGLESDVSVGFIGDLSLNFTPRRDTRMTLALSQRVSPDSLGDLRTAQTLRGALAYRINNLSGINLMGAFTNSTSTANGSGSRQAWTISPSYTHALTRSWDMTLSYRWLKSNVAHSSTALLTLSHRGTILP